MNEPIQQMLDSAQRYMGDAQQRTYSGPAGTRVLQTLVMMLARHCLTDQQRKQVVSIINLHDDCLIHNGEKYTGTGK